MWVRLERMGKVFARCLGVVVFVWVCKVNQDRATVSLSTGLRAYVAARGRLSAAESHVNCTVQAAPAKSKEKVRCKTRPTYCC